MLQQRFSQVDASKTRDARMTSEASHDANVARTAVRVVRTCAPTNNTKTKPTECGQKIRKTGYPVSPSA